MFNPVHTVRVLYADQFVGRLALTSDFRAVFEYDPEWIRTGFSLSPFYLPLKSGVFTSKAEPFDGLFGVFADSLPDGWSHLLLDRWLINQGIKPASLTVLDRLCLVGKNGMGALTYEPDRSPDRRFENQSIDFYQQVIEKILKEEYTGSLQELMNKAGSSGGARPKILLSIGDGNWLVKFRSNHDPAEIGKIEYHYSLLAKSCGIAMPETCLMEGKYFATKRFDIEGDKRIHVHSAAGLLHASHRLPSLDYSGLMKATALLTRDIHETEKMFRLMVFNVLIGNKDDHAKNFSFLFKNGQWIVSPAYDLLPSEGFNGHHTTSVNGNGKPGISDCLAVAKESSFPLTRAETIIEEVENGLKSNPTLL